MSYADEGDYAAAIRDWTKAIGMRPDRALLYTGRGAMFLMEGDYQNAADDYRHAIALDADAPDAHAGWAWRCSHWDDSRRPSRNWRNAPLWTPHRLMR